MSELVQLRWDRKLVNWALWVVSGNAHQRDSSLDFGSSRYRFDFTTRAPPPLVGEALDTHRLVVELEDERRSAVYAWYVWTGSQQERADELGVPYNTWRERVVAARYQLEDLALGRSSAVARTRRMLAFA